VLFLGLACAILLAACSEKEGIRKGLCFDFLSHLGEAKIEVQGRPMPALQLLGRSQPWTEKDLLFCPALQKAVIRFEEVPLGRNASLSVGYGLRPGAPDIRMVASQETVQFSVEILAGGQRIDLMSQSVNLSRLEAGKIIEERLAVPNLPASTGTFIFRSDGTPNSVLSRPCWYGPVLRSEGREALEAETRATYNRTECMILDGTQPQGSGVGHSFRGDFDEEDGTFLPREDGRLLFQRVPSTSTFLVEAPRECLLRFGAAVISEKRMKGKVRFQVIVDGKEEFTETLPIAFKGQPRRSLIPLSLPAAKRVKIEFHSAFFGMADDWDDSEVTALWIHPVIETEVAVARKRRGTGPNILLLVVDALRSDHLSCHGFERETSPRLDAIAKEGILFENAWSQSSWTIPATATLFTGQYSYTHGLYDAYHWYLVPGIATITQSMLKAGFSTAAFVSNRLISEDNNFSKGFEHFHETPFATAAQLHRSFFNWLDEHGDERFFAYVHYMEPHLPYAAPGKALNRFGQSYTAEFEARPGASEAILNILEMHLKELGHPERPLDVLGEEHLKLLEELENLYDSEIAYWDEQFGLLVDALKSRGLYEDTLIVVTSDHGEEFLDHGMLRHGQSLYDELLQVPLIFLNTGRPAERRSDPVGLIDVAPTLLALVGLKTPAARSSGAAMHEGADLFGMPLEREFLHAETAHGLRRIGAPEMIVLRAAFSEAWKGILNVDDRRLALFDRVADPDEMEDIAMKEANRTREMMGRIAEWVRACRAQAPYNLSLFDASAMEKLRQMGYVK
jgi:arylsulfatase